MLRVPRLGGAGQVVLPPRGNPARPPFLTRREKELVLSDHFDTRSAHTFQGKCFVHTLTEYKKLSMARLKDFFCRFEYKVASASITPVPWSCYSVWKSKPFLVDCLFRHSASLLLPDNIGSFFFIEGTAPVICHTILTFP